MGEMEELLEPRGPHTKWARFVGRRLCSWMGHKFVAFSDNCKRCCTRCDREEWLMSNPYPRVGQPKYFWQHMPWRD